MADPLIPPEKQMKEELNALMQKGMERREEERKQLELEEAERKALADKGMYFCLECEKTHKKASKIGELHKENAK